jgi:glucose/arabinose dehydrogenase
MRPVWMWVIAFLTGASPALAQLSSALVVSGLSSPVAVVQDPTQRNVQFIVEQAGHIRIVRDGHLESLDFLDLTSLVLSGGERGLLGLAFAPDYATSRRFFVNYTRRPDGHTVVSRYRRAASNPLRADPASRFDVRWPDGHTYIAQPFANHNGGDLQFGSDGYLYIPLGDGGGSNDPAHRAQNPAVLLGKILRIDIDVPDADFEGYDVPADNPFFGRPGVLPEIWAFGLRNPFRVTVDAAERGGTGGLVIADVGQNAWEEIDYEPFGAGGRNYGWRNREGAHANVTTLPPAFTPLTDPIFEYSHAIGNVITGGVVYRGAALGVGFFGRYFFADFGGRRVWSVGLTVNATTREARVTQLIEHTNALGGSSVVGNVSAFGVGANCEVYFLNWSAGQLRRIVNANSGPAPQCPTSPDPFLALGGGVFVDGMWVSRDNPLAPGAGLGGSTGGSSNCTTTKPAFNWVCVNGNWLPPDHPLAIGTSGTGGTGDNTGGTGGSTGGSGTTGSCTTTKPASTWVCVSGNWLPPDHPLAIGTPGTGGTGGSTGGTGGGTGGTGTTGICTTTKPASNWVCVSGNWLPPDHPLAIGTSGTGGTGSTGGSTGGTGTTTGCTTTKPASNWVCVSGNWLPPDHPLALGSGGP